MVTKTKEKKRKEKKDKKKQSLGGKEIYMKGPRACGRLG